MRTQGSKRSRQRPILAISSGGGHWVQLMRLRPSWEGTPVVYASVSEELRERVGEAPFYVVPDGNTNTKLALVWMAVRVFILVLRIRPVAVVSTGAAPGFFAIVFGKLVGAKTAWVDSIANADRLSLSGRSVRWFADAWLTQWEHLADPSGPQYRGSVL